MTTQTLLTILALALAPVEPVELRPVPVKEGFRDVVGTKGDPEKLRESSLQKHAQKLGIDLAAEPAHPLLVHGCRDGRLFYVFFKTVEKAFGDRPYLIQRIKKTERTWPTEDAEPEVKVTYQVEVFKTLAGQLKRHDQHYGYFALRGAKRREIVKEYEIGFGEVPGRCEGTAWPFDGGVLFKMLKGYGPERGIYDEVRFTRSVEWSLTVRFDDAGKYIVASPELGIDAPAGKPDPGRATPRPVEASKRVVVVEGEGIDGIVSGKTPRAAVDKAIPKPLQVVEWASGHTNIVSPRGYVVNLTPEGVARTIFTIPGFLGATRKGARHGDTRERIVELYGLPERQMTDAAWWRYDGVSFWFDGFERVGKILVKLQP